MELFVDETNPQNTKEKKNRNETKHLKNNYANDSEKGFQ